MNRKRPTAGDRELVATRAKGRCEYCQSPAKFATQSFAIEHILPTSRGGKTVMDNLALACPGCNGHKYDKTEAPDPVDGGLVTLFNPRQQQWLDHFKWSEDFSHVVGLTPTGRATVSVLNMNRPGIVNIRLALFAIGSHPPPGNRESP